jgi:hypothetical protein
MTVTNARPGSSVAVNQWGPVEAAACKQRTLCLGRWATEKPQSPEMHSEPTQLARGLHDMISNEVEHSGYVCVYA